MKLSLTVTRRLIFAAALISSIYSAADAQPKRPIMQISARIVNGKALSLPKPDYPDDARKAKLSGTVNVQVLIDETGKVVSAKAVSGLENVSLRIAAETAARKATFSPTLLSGRPVKVSGEIAYNFVPERSSEEKLKVLGVSAYLSVVRAYASDFDKFKEAFDEKEMFKDVVAEFGEFGPELKALESIEKMSVDKRFEALDTASSSIRSKLSESDQWQFEVGKDLGELLGTMMWSLVSGTDPGDFSKLDSAGFKLSLNKIRDLTLTAPQDFPPGVLAKLKDLTDVGDKENLSTYDNLKEFYDKLAAFFEGISPGSTK